MKYFIQRRLFLSTEDFLLSRWTHSPIAFWLAFCWPNLSIRNSIWYRYPVNCVGKGISMPCSQAMKLWIRVVLTSFAQSHNLLCGSGSPGKFCGSGSQGKMLRLRFLTKFNMIEKLILIALENLKCSRGELEKWEELL
jgi:hypothetical protein